MEISDDDSTSNISHHHPPKSSSLLNLISNPYPTASSSASSSSASSNSSSSQHNFATTNRTHLDPRQNRHNPSAKKSSSPPSSRPPKKSPDHSRPSSRDAKKRDRSPTPVRDEAGAQAANRNQPNPLDFLTKFINKSSVAPAPAQPSSNLSYLVSSLQKFVNTNSANPPPPPPPPYAPNQFGYDLNYQNSFMQSDAGSQPPPQRAVTPTKDELYQQQQQQPPMIPPSFILPPPPPPPPPLGYPQLYPQPPPPNQTAPLLIDPGNPAGFHPNYMYPNPMHVNYHPHFQQAKMPLMSPPSLMGAQMLSQSSSQAQAQSPGLGSPNMAKPSSFWQQDLGENGASSSNDGVMRRGGSNEAQFRFNSPAGSKSNDNQGYYSKRKFNYQEEEAFYNSAPNKFGSSSKGHDKASNFNRIPTINSNRNDNGSGAGGSGGGGGAGGGNRNQSNGSNRYY